MKINFINNNNFSTFKEPNIIILLLLFFFMGTQFYGPLLINLSHLLWIIYFTFLVRRNIIYFKIELNFLVLITLFFLFYLILNSFFLFEKKSILIKSIFYFRFILFAYILSKFLSLIEEKHHNLSIFLLLLSILLSLDVIYQSLFGYDIFGFRAGICSFLEGEQNLNPKNCERFSGFFGEEYIAGSFLSTYGIFSIYFYYLISNKKFINLTFIILSLILIVYATIVSGERNAFLSLLIIVFFNILFNKSLRKYFLITLILLSIILVISLKISSHVKYRYFEWPLSNISIQKGNTFKKFLQTQWGSHYLTANEIFINHKFFGSGFKSFRLECQKDRYNFELLNEKYDLNLTVSGCSTHPHNLYLEILSELGITGLILFGIFIISLLIYPLQKNFRKIEEWKSIIMILSIILTFLFPFRPTGSFSSTGYVTNLFFFIGFYLYFVTKNRKHE